LDQEVLAALPEDIRQEVLQAYQTRSSSQVKKNEVVTSMKSPSVEQVLKCYGHHVHELSANFVIRNYFQKAVGHLSMKFLPFSVCCESVFCAQTILSRI
jgi:hypothetical protein